MKHILICTFAIALLIGCSSKETTGDAPAMATESGYSGGPADTSVQPPAETPAPKASKKAYRMEDYEK
jgi:PBP1b-binding outer membrane lipoprotein LpoB